MPCCCSRRARKQAKSAGQEVLLMCSWDAPDKFVNLTMTLCWKRKREKTESCAAKASSPNKHCLILSLCFISRPDRLTNVQ